MRKTVSLLVIWAGLAVWPALAQDKHCLWKAQAGGAPVYLLGSVHVLSEAQYPLPQAIEDAYATCDQLVLEMNLDSAATPAAMMLVMSKVRLPEGQSLKVLLGPETWQKARDAAQPLGVNLESLDGFQPWYVSTLMTMAALGKHGFSPQYGLDMHFFDRAKKDAKTIDALETVAFQMNLFASLGDTLQSAFMQESLDELGMMETEFDRLVGHWSAGRSDSLEAMLLQGFTREPAFYQSFLVARNEAWLPRVQSMLQGDVPTLVVVGAAHLVGRDGLVTRLRDLGVQVEQL